MNFEQFVIMKDENILLLSYFSHDECNVCKVLKPQVKELAVKYNIAFEYINVKESPEISGQYIVFAVPTIILFIDGREGQRYSRHFSLQELEATLDKYSKLVD